MLFIARVVEDSIDLLQIHILLAETLIFILEFLALLTSQDQVLRTLPFQRGKNAFLHLLLLFRRRPHLALFLIHKRILGGQLPDITEDIRTIDFVYIRNLLLNNTNLVPYRLMYFQIII